MGFAPGADAEQMPKRIRHARSVREIRRQVNRAGSRATPCLAVRSNTHPVRLKLGQQIVEEPLEKFPRPMGVGVGQVGTFGGVRQTQMLKFALAALEPVGDLAQGPRLGQLTEEHRHELVPAGKALGPVFGFERAHVPVEIGALKAGEDLAQQTACSNHKGLRCGRV